MFRKKRQFDKGTLFFYIVSIKRATELLELESLKRSCLHCSNNNVVNRLDTSAKQKLQLKKLNKSCPWEGDMSAGRSLTSMAV